MPRGARPVERTRRLLDERPAGRRRLSASATAMWSCTRTMARAAWCSSPGTRRGGQPPGTAPDARTHAIA